MLVALLESLFRHGLRDFAGISAASRWHDRTYPVLRLDFARCQNFSTLEEFDAAVAVMLEEAFAAAGLKLDGGGAFGGFSRFLALQPVVSLVLLVDNYNAPLAAHWDDPYLFNAVRSRLSAFYSWIKATSGCLRFLFVTGVLRFGADGVLSSINSITDISQASACGALAGFTQNEIEANFGDALDRAATVLGVSRCDVLDQLEKCCGGFCFDDARARTRLFSPLEVQKCLCQPELVRLAAERKTIEEISPVLASLSRRNRLDPALWQKAQTMAVERLKDCGTPGEERVATLLVQTGCLTITAVEDSVALLECPNELVKKRLLSVFCS